MESSSSSAAAAAVCFLRWDFGVRETSVRLVCFLDEDEVAARFFGGSGAAARFRFFWAAGTVKKDDMETMKGLVRGENNRRSIDGVLNFFSLSVLRGLAIAIRPKRHDSGSSPQKTTAQNHGAAMRGATVLKTSDDKTRQLNKHTLVAFSGEAGDTVQFAEYIQANAQLYSMRNETDLSPSALAHFVRGELASSLRSRKPYNVNLLLGGVDPITHKPSLYWLDYLASLASVPYAAHGYAQYYCLSILDKHHHPDITLGQGIKLLNLCTDELKRRLPIDFKGMLVKAVTKDGVVDIEFDDDKVVKAAGRNISEARTHAPGMHIVT
ncbi:hypothetical protein P8C59_001604 [Phyllachora maydis]|uniref:Proteasome subunit beta n=1 Tax=Phyllachora maydis TaxID=1825666 RepID=A0AAD9MAF0_9PEZI|nr:hypothetical protein P8C59_001604 [Phyllachora maydis]